MRKEKLFGMSRADSLALIDRAPFVRVASTNESGEPVLRALNAARVDDRIVFHGSHVGEKTEALGRACVVSVEEVVASIPSYFVDAERACPATTLYRSVQIHGTFEEVSDSREKARALTALLAKHQPEGGFVPISHDHALYQKAIAGLLVVSVSLERLDGKAKLAQNRTPPEQRRIVSELWKRGHSGDAEAAFAIRAANPEMPLPDFMIAPHGLRSDLGKSRDDARACADLLKNEYWNDRFSVDELLRAHLESIAWILLRDEHGAIVASARAISDGTKYAWIYDVIVAPAWRGKNVGDAVVRLLIDHPAVRRARFVRLATRDAMKFYARVGFIETRDLPPRAYTPTEMILVR